MRSAKRARDVNPEPKLDARRRRCACAASVVAALALPLVADAQADRPSIAELARERHELTLDPGVVAQALDGLGLPGDATLGYSSDQMRFYGRDAHLLRTVEVLFRDALDVPRHSGLTAARMFEAASELRFVGNVRWAFLLLDQSAAREIGPVAEGAWGAPWLDDEADAPLPPSRAMVRLMQHLGAPYAAVDREAFNGLPEAIQRLTVRLLLAHVRAQPWIEDAIDQAAVRRAAQARLDRTGAGPLAVWAFADAYEAAVAPFREGDDDASPEGPVSESVALIETFDLASLAYGSLLYTQLCEQAINEFRAWRFESGWTPSELPAGFRAIRLETPLGVVRVMGPGDDLIDLGREVDLRRLAAEGGVAESRGCALLIDLGGDDTYRGRVATTGVTGLLAGGTRLTSTVTTLVDLDGNDTYEADGEAAAIAVGFFGQAGLFDLAGADTYNGGESSIARALFGSALLIDFAGDDIYTNDGFFSQGCAHVGSALLIDLAGADQYQTDAFGQGMGGTLGVGGIVDLDGNDRYTARDDGNVQDIYWSLSVSMAQGVGFGRRADYGDGKSMAGGFGLLLDARGDDEYYASVWSQGAAYWWSAGILEDWSGNDIYRNGWYSLAAGAHFGVASAVDLRGADLYNLANDAAVTQHHAVARDGSIAVAIDGSGSDTYQARSRSLGAADLGSVAILWDRAGDDEYRVRLSRVAGEEDARPLPYREDPPLGGVTVYPPFHTFRDDVLTVGLFLDTGGQDVYEWPGGPAGNSTGWEQSRSAVSRGFGLDVGGSDEPSEGER